MEKIIERIKNFKYLEYIFLSFVVVLGFLARLYKIDNPVADWHSWRQADTASVTKTFVQKGLNLLYPRYHDISSIQTGYFNPEGLRLVEFPIFNAIHFFFFRAFPKFSLEVWGRLVSVLVALISAVFIFLIGKRFLGRWGGVLAAFFFLFIPFNIYFTRVILPEPTGQLFALVSLWLFVRFIDADKNFWLFLSGTFLGLALLIKPFLLFYAVPMVYLASVKYDFKNLFRNPKNLIRFSIFVDIVLVPLLIWRGWIGRHPEGIPFFTWAFNGDRIRFHPAFWRWIFGERLGRLILGVWGLVPFTIGTLIKRRNYFTLSFLVGALVYVFVIATASVRHDYYQIFLVPPVSLILAEGVLWLWQQKIFVKWLARLAIIFAVFLMELVGWSQIKENYKINHPEIIAAGAAVDRLVPKDALVIAPYNGDTAFLYQTNRWGWPAVDDSFENLIKKGASYYVSVDLGSADTKYVTGKYRTILRTDQYVLVDLTQKL